VEGKAHSGISSILFELLFESILFDESFHYHFFSPQFLIGWSLLIFSVVLSDRLVHTLVEHKVESDLFLLFAKYFLWWWFFSFRYHFFLLRCFCLIPSKVSPYKKTIHM